MPERISSVDPWLHTPAQSHSQKQSSPLTKSQELKASS
jgi:hypothetical protein